MRLAHTFWLSAFFLLVMLSAAIWLYPRMPAQVPIHWDVRGQIDGYASPFWAMAAPLIMIAVLALLTVALPAISPRRYEIAPFARVFRLVMLAGQALVMVMAFGIWLNVTGHPVRMPWLAMLAVGLLFMVVGNYMGKWRKNFFIGIRTPWTLASDAVWERTHRLGGLLFVLGGLLMVLMTLAGVPLWPMLCVAATVVVVPVVYSYLAYRRVDTRE